MQRFLRTIRTDWPRLIIELFVVVAGISISFALDEWRRDREDRREERRHWTAIGENLTADSAYLAKRCVQLERIVSAYNGLLSGGPPDSLDSYMDQAISYAVFTPTQTAYHELEQLAGSRLIRNRALLSELTSLYNREYIRTAEWDGINRNFILDRFIPYLDETAPFVEGTGGAEQATGMSAVYRSVQKRDQFRNLVRTNKIFKDAQLSVYRAALKRAVAIRQQIRAELAGTVAQERTDRSGR
ncbi:MAG: hypothetical protein V4550_02205 [Gemmatimonadota bacterium]